MTYGNVFNVPHLCQFSNISKIYLQISKYFIETATSLNAPHSDLYKITPQQLILCHFLCLLGQIPYHVQMAFLLCVLCRRML